MNKIATAYKNAFSGLSSSTWWLSFVMLVNRSGTMVVPFMTLYLTQSMHVSIGKAGIVMSLFGAGAICGSLIGGRLTDKFNFYFIQVFALIGGGILFLILGQMKSYLTICIFTFLLSLVNESFRPANSTAIAHYSKEENRTRSYSLNRLAINLGWAIGGAFGGIVASWNYHFLFWIDGITNIGAAFVLIGVLAPSRNKATQRIHEKNVIDNKESAYRDKPYLVFIFLTILFSYSFFQLFTTLPVYYVRRLHLSPSYVGVVMALNGLIIAFFEMIIIYNLEGKRKNLQYITVGVLLTGISFIIFNILPGAGALAIIAMLTVTLGEILSMPFMNSFWISRTTQNNRGQYAGLYSISWSVAQVLGPGTGAEIAQYYGFTSLWWMIGGICVAASIGYKILQQYTT
ncbi:MAG TPA: MFS transporter [Flavipsychrobacter sp.]|nr:MFS transporter [Flavipsychrobacter sp.]